MALSNLDDALLEAAIQEDTSKTVENVLPEQSAVHTSVTKKSVTSSKTKRKTKPVTPTNTTGVFRNIPTSVIKAIRAEFCDATNNQDALMAYLACHGSGSVAERANANLTETQRALVDNWDGDSYSAIVKQMEQLVARFEKMSHTVDVNQLLMAYMVYDRLGFRTDMPQTPKDTNLREDGVIDMVLQAEEQVTGFQHEKNTILGRPIRK